MSVYRVVSFGEDFYMVSSSMVGSSKAIFSVSNSGVGFYCGSEVSSYVIVSFIVKFSRVGYSMVFSSMVGFSWAISRVSIGVGYSRASYCRPVSRVIKSRAI
jgi:hypothetical protein